VECAVPVRGRVLGIECLSDVLGGDVAETEPQRPWRRMRSPMDRAAGLFLATATLVTFLPWTRFSTGSGFAGAWAFGDRWSMLAAVGAVVGLGVWLASTRRFVIARIAAVAGGMVVSAGSLLAIWNPPPFTKPASAPWIALVAGVGSLVAGAVGGIGSTTSRV
jgi:hypothetical protein